MGDRHVVHRNYKSGSEKRKIQDERNKKVEEVLSKTPKISSFFAAGSTSAAAGESETESNVFRDPVPLPVPSEEASSSKSIGSDSIARKVEEKVNPNFEKDVGKWSKLSAKEIDYWIAKGPSELHNCDDEQMFENFSVSQDRGDVTGFRKCTKSLFYRKLQNETVFRNWLCFSPDSGKLYCFFCKLMNVSLSNFSGDGFCNWKRAQEKLSSHETSKDHLESSVAISLRAGKLGLDQSLKREVSFRQTTNRPIKK